MEAKGDDFLTNMKYNYSLLLSVGITAFFIYSGCSRPKTNLVISRNDTSEVIRLLLDSTLYLPRLMDMSLLFKNNPFGDSVIVVRDSIIVNHAPKGINFIFLTQDEICALAERYKNETSSFANYLKLDYHEENDSVFEASIANFQIERIYYDNIQESKNQRTANNLRTFTCLDQLGSEIYMSFTKRNNTITSRVENIYRGTMLVPME